MAVIEGGWAVSLPTRGATRVVVGYRVVVALPLSPPTPLTPFWRKGGKSTTTRARPEPYFPGHFA